MRNRKIFAALLIAALLVGVLAVSVNAQTFYQKFENIWAKTLTTTGNATVGGALSVVGNGSVGGTLATTGASTAASYTATGKVQAGTFIASTVANTITVTADGTITPTGSLQPITAAGAVGTSNLVVLPNGTVLMLVNVGSNAITITDTGTNVLSGNIALGTGDTLTLQSNGVNWYQLATSNN